VESPNPVVLLRVGSNDVCAWEGYRDAAALDRGAGVWGGFGAEVRAVVLDEPGEDRIVGNYLAREPRHGEQRNRAKVSIRIGAKLVERAARCGVPVVSVWPWTDVLDRVDRALRGDAAARRRG
jgi:hypothetical protein